ncbi:MAG: RNA polymerase sigma factor, RpoD/SigA family [Cyanobacteria bacterium P01_F01_bin.3]
MDQSKSRKPNQSDVAAASDASVATAKSIGNTLSTLPGKRKATSKKVTTMTTKEKAATKKKTVKKKVAKKATSDKTATKKAAKKKAQRKAKPLYTTDAVRAYLHEIGRVPLLSHEDEIVLGKQVQKMMALLVIKEELADKLPVVEDDVAESTEASDVVREVSDAEWAEAAELTVAELNNHMRRGQRAKRKMIEANLRLVVAVAKKYQKRNLEFLDLIQEGTLGLERGVEKFDPMKGYKFSTYAYWWIRQAITRAIAQQARTIRLPIHITEKLNKIKRVQRELSQKLGRSPNATEIGMELELEPRQVREYLSIARQPISLDVRIGDNQDTELQDLLEDDGASPEDYTVQKSLQQDLRRMLLELTTQQQEVINLRFGLADGNPLSLAKVGQRMGISRERVRQLEQQALKHLRRRKATINGYLAAS